jgi:hypothetical protein
LVASDIVLELPQPEFDPAFGDVCKFAPLMSVPEAPINEDGELLCRKHEIWFAEDTTTSPPTGDAMVAE